MAEIDKLINEGENINENASSKFESSVQAIELALANEIRKLFKNVDVTGGKISSNKKSLEFLAGLEKRIMTALKESGYNSRVSELLKNFDKIKENTIKIQSVANGINIADASLTGIQKLEVQNTIDKLLGSGVNGQFVAPMRQALYRNIALGGSIADAEKIIEDYIISKGNNKSILNRYIGQVARDSISQFDGMIQGVIGTELGLNDYLYAGSIIKDSRCQCVYWVEKRILPREELIDEINTALNKGSLGGCRCSGMIPGTSIDTFATFRGGYNCRHRAIKINAYKFKG